MSMTDNDRFLLDDELEADRPATRELAFLREHHADGSTGLEP
jgi:hypothetical protein